MLNFFDGLKTFIVGVIASAVSVISPSIPVNTQTTLPVATDNGSYINVQGTYSYLGQGVKYIFLVPKKGGSFSGTVEGVCRAKADGNYEGGNGGKIIGNATGSCSIFGMKKEGSTGFSGKLYPDKKTVELDIDNSPIHGFKINYN